jgi:hypothetical protein
MNINTKKTFLNQKKFNKVQNSEFTYIGLCLDTGCTEKGVELAADAIREISDMYTNIDGSDQPIKVYNCEEGYILKG